MSARWRRSRRYDVDLVLVFRPPFLANFQPLMSLQQRLVALMPADHPLAARKKIRLSDCVGYPVALAERSLGGRQLLAEVLARSNLRFDIVAESNSFEFLRGMVLRDKVISFQIEIGAVESEDGWWCAQIDDRDVPRADLVLGQLRGRNLPVPAAKFAEQLARVLEGMRRLDIEQILPQPFTRAVSTPAILKLFHTVVDTVS